MNWHRFCVLALLAAISLSSSYGLTIAASDKEADGEEQAVSLKQLPDAVKATILTEILREVDGLTFEEVQRETEDGQFVYEAEFEYNGKEIELEIAADGRLLAKEVELEDEDDEDEDKEHEDDEDEDDE